MKNHLGGLIFSIIALASSATQATSFSAIVGYTGVNGPQASAEQNYAEANAHLDSHEINICGGGYYSTCSAFASSSPGSISTNASNNGSGQYGWGYLTSTAKFTETITNTTGQTQSYTFDFHVTGANLYIRAFDNLSLGYASLSANILVNGANVWNTGAFMSTDQGGTLLTTSGAGASAPQHTFSETMTYSYDYLGSLSLGSLAAGSSFTINYELSSTAAFNDRNNCGWECYEARASINDPFASSATVHQVSTVPEPESYALFLVGLGVVLGMRRRRAHAASLSQNIAA